MMTLHPTKDVMKSENNVFLFIFKVWVTPYYIIGRKNGEQPLWRLLKKYLTVKD